MHNLVTSHSLDTSLSQYGDGVFETMLGVGNTIYHFDYHWARLRHSCQRLAIAEPNEEILLKELTALLLQQNSPLSVVKMIVSRGKGLRGYKSLSTQPCDVTLSITPYEMNPKHYQGLNLRVCQTRLASQPLLAGMKHCNRLEYVMARREEQEQQFDDGLLLDYDGFLIEGLISNVFLLSDKKITTPKLDKAGVAGTLRAYLFNVLPEAGYYVEQVNLSLTEVAEAEAVFLTNATSGVMPVRQIQGINKTFKTHLVDNIQDLVGHPCLVK